ncbi:electron transport complex subunit RsxD [Pleionea sp. CnH1-48]|uniref:electron transport complex subunit RsxD n=1 Tax=Pleionea sp. CnH1-48 TaxID=2954494 RepID=UPI002096A159|nr:electron transport complex subunit RsxD [Pleionea sp. CnH1-48]MCO7222923.1 electron transport complex subunit RsxD [Pleionea sp. CnH1-48]
MFNSSPHQRASNSVSNVMLQVVYAAIPGAAALFYFFGWGVIFNLITCISFCLVSEALTLKLRSQPTAAALKDNSALVTAILLGLALPPLAPWWVAAIGSIFAIVFAKQLYGGMGYNPFNPAMCGYVLLLISFPVAMTAWLPPAPLAEQSASFTDSLSLFLTGRDLDGYYLDTYRYNADGFTMATPLDQLKTGYSMGFMNDELLSHPVFTDFAGVGWQWVNLAFLLGGIYLLARKIISWHIPVSMLIAMAVVSALMSLYDSGQTIGPIMHCFSGATMLGAFFIATDPVSASTTTKGRLIFGAGIGIFVVVIRNYGGYPDAVAFAVLLMNMAAPLIDHFTQPKVYGSPSKTPEVHD